MALEFRLPDVGEGLHEAEINRWLVREGDTVTEDQPLVEVATDKVTVELPAPTSGRIAKLMAKEGETVQVGSVIVVFGPADGAVQEAEAGENASAGQTDAPTAGLQPATQAEAQAPPAGVTGRALATPAVRRIAREMGIDLHAVSGSGPNGRVTREDLERFAARPAQAEPSPATPPSGLAAPPVSSTPAAEAAGVPAVQIVALAGQRVPLKGIRKVIAEAMVHAKHTIPHVTIHDEVDFTALVSLRQQAKVLGEQRGIKVTYLPFLVKAITASLREFPYLNARLDEQAQEIVLLGEYNIGIAVDTAAGLVVPVVKDADKKSIFQLAAEIQDLTNRAHARKLTVDDLRGGTFSISNMGAVGAGMHFTPVINHPEVAILGVGKISERPVVRDGTLTVGRVGFLSLSFDHRVVDGGPATRFLARLIQFLTNPNLLMMEMI